MKKATMFLLLSLFTVFSTFAVEPIIIQGQSEGSNCLAFSPNSKILAFGSTWDMKLWSMEKMAWTATIKGFAYISSLDFSPDGKLLAVANGNKMISLWNMDTMTLAGIISGHKEMVTEVDFSPDGKLLVSGSLDGTVRVWDVQTKECLHVLYTGIKGEVAYCSSVAFSPNGKIIASASFGLDDVVQLWDMATENCLLTIEAREPVSFSPNGKILASWGKLWDVSDIIIGEPIYIKELASFDSGYSQAFSPDGKTIAHGYNGISFFNIEKGSTAKFFVEELTYIMGHPAFSLDGKFVAVVDIKGKIALWNLEEIGRSVDSKGKATTTWGSIKK